MLSGFANGVCLVFVALHIIKESFERLLEPPEACPGTSPPTQTQRAPLHNPKTTEE